MIRGTTTMPKTTILGATLALAMAWRPPDTTSPRHGSRADVVLEWNQLLQDTLPPPGNPLTPRFYSMMHIAMFDAINAIEREFEPYRVRLRPGSADRPTPRPHRPRTTCSWRSIPRRRRRMTPRLRPTLATSFRVRSSAARRLARTSRGRFSRGGRTTAGLSRPFRPTPSHPFLDAGSRRRRPTPPPRSRISSLRRRWRCSRPRSFCRRRRRRSRARDTPPTSTR